MSVVLLNLIRNRVTGNSQHLLNLGGKKAITKIKNREAVGNIKLPAFGADLPVILRAAAPNLEAMELTLGDAGVAHTQHAKGVVSQPWDALSEGRKVLLSSTFRIFLRQGHDVGEGEGRSQEYASGPAWSSPPSEGPSALFAIS